jgi:hypothetical protein
MPGIARWSRMTGCPVKVGRTRFMTAFARVGGECPKNPSCWFKVLETTQSGIWIQGTMEG